MLDALCAALFKSTLDTFGANEGKHSSGVSELKNGNNATASASMLSGEVQRNWARNTLVACVSGQFRKRYWCSEYAVSMSNVDSASTNQPSAASNQRTRSAPSNLGTLQPTAEVRTRWEGTKHHSRARTRAHARTHRDCTAKEKLFVHIGSGPMCWSSLNSTSMNC